MPEGGVIIAFERKLQRERERYEKKHKKPLTGVLQLLPCTFTLGNKGRSYTTAVADREDDYRDTLDALPLKEAPAHLLPSPMDIERSKVRKKPTSYSYLVRPRKPGPVQVQARGKILAVSAGYHAVFVIHSLEAHWVSIPVADYAELRTREVNGPNANRRKASRMRSFRQLDKYIEHDSTDKERLVTIHLAIVCDEFVWILLDFSRLARIHVMSRGTYWTADDLKPGTPVWTKVLGGEYGPDWYYEREDALRLLDEWRHEQLEVEHNSKKSIVDALSHNLSVFNGWGQHTANDLLHLLGIHPVMPIWVLCGDDRLFQVFRNGLLGMSDEWHSLKFHRRVGGECNSLNPFTFHDNAHRAYKASYVHVYRTFEACVRKDLYRKLLTTGLLDPQHVIDAPYDCAHKTLDIDRHIFQPVYYYSTGSKPNSGYSVIQAVPPEEWGLDDLLTKDDVKEDFRNSGKQSTLGSASFYDKIQNMPVVQANKKAKVGRRKIIRTGKGGRPRVEKTLAELEALGAKKTKSAIDFSEKLARRAAKTASTLPEVFSPPGTRSAAKRKGAIALLDINSPTKRVKSQ